VALASYQATPWKAASTPPLDLPDLDGRRWTLASQRGRVVLVNFWATWCEPCRAEMPSLQALAERMGDKLAVVGVNYQEGEPRVRGFVERMSLRFPIVLDRDGEAAKAWTRRIFPTTVLVDPRGRAHTVVVGEIDWMGTDAAKLLAAAGAAR
jgi:thiol-disulfide isomerase/thioredoxin